MLVFWSVPIICVLLMVVMVFILKGHYDEHHTAQTLAILACLVLAAVGGLWMLAYTIGKISS